MATQFMHHSRWSGMKLWMAQTSTQWRFNCRCIPIVSARCPTWKLDISSPNVSAAVPPEMVTGGRPSGGRVGVGHGFWTRSPLTTLTLIDVSVVSPSVRSARPSQQLVVHNLAHTPVGTHGVGRHKWQGQRPTNNRTSWWPTRL